MRATPATAVLFLQDRDPGDRRSRPDVRAALGAVARQPCHSLSFQPGCRADTASSRANGKRTSAMALTVREAIRLEHQELDERLRGLTRLSGHVGATARAVARLLHPHFQKEEELALPPLALLPALAQDDTPADVDEARA